MDDGYVVAANYRSPNKAEVWKEQLEAAGYAPHMFKADVADYAQVGNMIELFEAELGTVDILVNNAGITRDGAFKKMSPENWDAVMKTNLYSVFNCCRHVINPMIDQGYGRIINISSVNGQRAQFGQCNYAAAKAGMHGFTKTLAIEVARKGVTVNTISPGYIATDMVMAVDESVREKIVKGIPIGRLAALMKSLTWFPSWLQKKLRSSQVQITRSMEDNTFTKSGVQEQIKPLSLLG